MRWLPLLLTGALCLLTTICGAQDPPRTYVTKKTVKGKAKKAFDKGMEYNFKDQNTAAIKEFKKALKYEPALINAHLQIAACYYAMKEYAAAEENFEKVVDIDPHYNKKVLYTLGLSEMHQGKYREAAGHFADYIDSRPKNKILPGKATKYMAQCNFIEKALKNPVPFEPKSLGDKINTDAWEYLPSLTADENTLIYTRRQGDEDFYMSRLKDGEWQEGKPLEAINTPLNEGAQSISADGKFMVFTACDRKDGLGMCDLYFSEVRNNRWTKPQNLGRPVNSKSSDKQPSITANGQKLYFSSNRAGGHGKYDIWVSTRQKDGSWSKAQNLGPAVNSPEHENTPFIHADGQTLYFMSDGHPGMGKFDLYYSRMGPDRQWASPTNLGYPINTMSNDAALIVSLDGKTAYFASDRDYVKRSEMDQARTDLYSFELYPEARPNPVTYVQARVYHAANRSPLVANVEFVDLANGQTHTSSTTDEDGAFLVCLPSGTDYALKVALEGFLFHSENFALTDHNDIDRPFQLDIYLQPIPESGPDPADAAPAGSPIVLKNVFFDSGSAQLRQASYYELNSLKQLLDQHPDLQIRISGHTDNVGAEADNQLLSEQRAKAVFEYLVQQGINAARLHYKGFGESRPIKDNGTAAGRQENRRIEFELLQ